MNFCTALDGRWLAGCEEQSDCPHRDAVGETVPCRFSGSHVSGQGCDFETQAEMTEVDFNASQVRATVVTAVTGHSAAPLLTEENDTECRSTHKKESPKHK